MKTFSEVQLGMFYALVAYLLWGFAPLYFKYLHFIPVHEILAHRVIWSLLVTAIIISISGAWGAVGAVLLSPKKLAWLIISTLLISCNWIVFIWSVHNGRMLDASLGYFINPIMNVLLGLIFLNESLSRLKWLAVMLAFSGVLIQVFALGALPWVSLVLPISFSFYALVRKKVKVASVTGLFIETLLVFPIALYYLFILAHSEYVNMFENSLMLNFWLMFAGIVTALPLIFFGQAALRLKLSSLGFFQYLAPSMMFFFAVVFYNEALDLYKVITFMFIWSGIVLFVFEKKIQQKLK